MTTPIQLSAESYIAPGGYAGFQPYIGRFITTILLSDGKSIRQLETHTVWDDEQNGIRFDTWELKEGKRLRYNNGLYLWNETKGEYTLHELKSDGSVISGTAKFEGKVLLQSFTVTLADGVIEEGSSMTFTDGPDKFTEKSAWLKDGHAIPASEVIWSRMK